MRAETPNERNYRLLRERFLKEDRIVFSDGNGNEHTLPELQQLTIKCTPEYNYYTRYLTGNESALHMLKSPSNILKDEVKDVIYDIEKQIIRNRIKWFIDTGHQLKVINYPQKDYCELYVTKENENHQLYGNEKMKLIKNENGNPIEVRFENGHGIRFEDTSEDEDEFCITNENGIPVRFENELENEPEMNLKMKLLKKMKNII
jgi:hypothetical protein